MIRASLDGKRIVLTADNPADSANIPMFPGATRTRRMPPLTWRMPYCLETVHALRDQRVPCSPELREAAKTTLRAEQYINHLKLSPGDTKPIADVPLKPGVRLYQHQIKAYNIALALYGQEIKKEVS